MIFTCRLSKVESRPPNSAANPLPTPFQGPKFRCRQLGQIASKALISLTQTDDFPAPKRVFSLTAGTSGRSAEAQRLVLLADQGQDERALMGRGAVLEEEDPLPHAELEPAVGDRDRQLRLGQRTLDVRRHVVGPLVVVAIEADVLRHDPAQEGVEIVAGGGGGGLLDPERGR